MIVRVLLQNRMMYMDLFCPFSSIVVAFISKRKTNKQEYVTCQHCSTYKNDGENEHFSNLIQSMREQKFNTNKKR